MSAEAPVRAFLGMGSNLGDRRAYLRRAVAAIDDVVAVSPIYETEPVGGPDQEAFLNIVVEVRTIRSPEELLALCHELEIEAARVRAERWGPRTLDVDVLYIDGYASDDPVLTVPHPRAHLRNFVMRPLLDLDPGFDVAEYASTPSIGDVRAVGPL